MRLIVASSRGAPLYLGGAVCMQPTINSLGSSRKVHLGHKAGVSAGQFTKHPGLAYVSCKHFSHLTKSELFGVIDDLRAMRLRRERAPL